MASFDFSGCWRLKLSVQRYALKHYGICPTHDGYILWLMDDIFPSCKMAVHLYDRRWWIFGFSMLLPLTEGEVVIGIASTSHLLQFPTLAFQAIKLFHVNFLLDMISPLHEWWLENCHDFLRISSHQIKIFPCVIFILPHLFPLPSIYR